MSRERYADEFSKAEAYFQAQIRDCGENAYEYGILVVRNAILISGGGLLGIPAIVGLAADIAIDTSAAALAGLLFALSLLAAIVGAYIIHINWTLHEAAWSDHWEQRQRGLRRWLLDGEPFEDVFTGDGSAFGKRIGATYWVPHALTGIYLVLISFAFYHLYAAFQIEVSS